MKQNIFPAIKLTAICLILFVGIYTLIIYSIAQLAPNKGEGEIVNIHNKKVGYKLEGQKFNEDKYMWGRPSAVDYNATTSSGSNKGPSNPTYLQDIRTRIDHFLVHNPSIKKELIPSDIVTASGSGLDPDISLEAAVVQIDRIASIRKISTKKINTLIAQQIQKPFLGFGGPAKINVLKFNIELDKMK